MRSTYKINAKYLTNYVLWQGTGFSGGGIKGKKENTKFAANREHKKDKKYLNSETTASLFCALPKCLLFFFLYTTDRQNQPV